MSKLKIITKPCSNCPYRKDAPVQLWHKEEFKKVLAAEQDEIGKIFKCHKDNGCICAGWLTDQDKRNFPSIMLRLELSKQGADRKLLDKLEKNTGLYSSIEEMIGNNFPELLK